MSLKIIGFCRFSFFGPTDTKLSYDDRDAAFQTLYDPDQMQSRFHLFEHLLLPSIAAQTDKDFKLVVLSSAVMPERDLTRLAGLCKRVEQVELVIHDREGLQDATRPYTTTRALRGNSLLQFRIDDDDALSCSFVERLRAWAPLLMDEMILTLPKGLMLFDLGNGPEVAPMFRPMTGAGFAWFSEHGTRRNVFNFSHISARKRYVTMSDPTPSGYIQSFTPTADTARLGRHKMREFLKSSGMISKHRRGVGTVVDEALAQDFPWASRSNLSGLLARTASPVPAE